MAAIITSEFRKNSRALFISDLKGNGETDSGGAPLNDYFIGLGKTDSWPDTTDTLGNQVTEYSRQFSAPLPVDTPLTKVDVLKNLMILVRTKSVEIFNVIPRNNWVINRIYKTFDPTDPKCFDYETIDGVAYYPCYVTSNDRIYLCLSNVDTNGEVTESAVAIPSGTGDNPYLTYNIPETISNGEGYIWAYVSSLDEDSKFYTDQFVNYTYPTPEQITANLSKTATGGLVYDFKIVNGVDPNAIPEQTKIEIIGTTIDANTGDIVPHANVLIHDPNDLDGTNFDVVFNGGIESIRYKPSAIPGSWAKDFLSASIQVTVNGTISGEPSFDNTVSPIEIIPFVLPYEGLGRYPDNDLPSFYAGIAVDFIGEVDGEAPVGYNVDVRQISLIKNPERSFSDNALDNDAASPPGFYAAEDAYDALKYLQLEANSLTRDYIGRDFIIEQTSTGAKAWLDYADNINEKLYYHQNSSPLVNFKKFSTASSNDLANGGIKITSIAGFYDDISYRIESCVDPEYVPDTGEVIFYENRKPINRNYNQTDEVKLVIQF